MPQAITITNEVELHQFKSLLRDLETSKKGTRIRMQVEGELWMNDFSTLLVLSGDAAILTHFPSRNITFVKDAGDVMGFELDQLHKGFLPFRRYYICPRAEQITNLDLRYD